jgi:hypothetical protein
MDGKETIVIGETTPFAMIVLELIATDMFSQGMTRRQKLRRKGKRTKNVDGRSWPGSFYCQTESTMKWAKSPEPTSVGAFISGVAVLRESIGYPRSY